MHLRPAGVVEMAPVGKNLDGLGPSLAQRIQMAAVQAVLQKNVCRNRFQHGGINLFLSYPIPWG